LSHQREEEAARAQREEEEKKQQAELEEFERKMKGGRKRRPRQRAEVTEEPGFLQKHRTLLVVSVSVAVLAAFLYYLMAVA